jgi:hypothetical protein
MSREEFLGIVQAAIVADRVIDPLGAVQNVPAVSASTSRRAKWKRPWTVFAATCSRYFQRSLFGSLKRRD